MDDFHGALGRVIANLKAPKGQRNTFGNYNYRNAEDILEAVKPLLAAEGLRMKISDKLSSVENRYYVEATVTVSGYGDSDSTTAFAREAETKKGMDEAQITGAASSYARKYALNGMFCIDDTKDADSHDNRTTAPKNDPTAQSAAATPNQKAIIKDLLTKQGILTKDMPAILAKHYGVTVGSVMSSLRADKIIKDIRGEEEFSENNN